jgi:hypothetical protein
MVDQDADDNKPHKQARINRHEKVIAEICSSDEG